MSGLLGLGVSLLQTVLVAGLLLALGRVALGMRDGHKHLWGVLLAALLLSLLEAGTLTTLIHQLVVAAGSDGGGLQPATPGPTL
jgi:hypothetical protein